VIQSLIIAKFVKRLDCAGFGIQAAKHQSPYARLKDGAYTHNAGLQCYVDFTFGQAPRTQRSGGFFNRQQFGMAQWTLPLFTAIKTAAHDLLTTNNHGSYWHFTPGSGRFGFRQRQLHVGNIPQLRLWTNITHKDSKNDSIKIISKKLMLNLNSCFERRFDASCHGGKEL
jgi:hypothetical protein